MNMNIDKGDDQSNDDNGASERDNDENSGEEMSDPESYTPPARQAQKDDKANQQVQQNKPYSFEMFITFSFTCIIRGAPE